jgi:hypothetical protein
VRARRYRPFPSFPEDYVPRNAPDYVALVDPVHVRHFDDTDERQKEVAYWHKVCSHLVVEKEEERDSNTVDRDLVEGMDVSSKDEESLMAKRLRKVIQVVELELDLDSRHSDETNHFASLDDHEGVDRLEHVE